MGTSDSVATDDVTVVVSDEVRLLVVGAEGLERDAIAEALDTREDLEVVGAVEHDDALVHVASAATQVAVVLYDDPSHLDLCRRLTLRRPPVGVILADSFRSVRDIAVCREVGARGFVHRRSPVAILIEAVRAVASGREFQDQSIPDEPLESFGLTDRELEVLSSLRPGRSNREIAEVMHISEDTVKYHLKGIYDKLDVNSREEALVIAIEYGIVKVPRS